MVQPLRAELLARALIHRLLHIVTEIIPAVEAVDPDQAVVVRLVLELSLAVDRPADEPARILCGDNAARNNPSGERIAVADPLNRIQDLLVRRVNGPGLPARLLDAAEELVRMTEGIVLRRELLPELNRRALAVLNRNDRRVCLIAVGRAVALRAICHKDKIVLREIDRLLLAALRVLDALCYLPVRRAVADNILNDCIKFNFRACILDVLHHRKNHRLVLVVACEAERRQVRQTVDVMDVALHVFLHFQSAVPFFKCKHRLPVNPEVRLVEVLIEDVIDRLVRKLLVGREHQLQELLLRALIEAVLLVRVRVLPLLLGDAAERIVRVLLVQLVILGENRLARVHDRRD